MKTCTRCGQTFPLSNFGTANGHGKSPRCKPCLSELGGAHYAANRDVIREQKRLAMAASRADPVKGERIRENSRRCYRNGANARQAERLARMRHEEPFRYRAQMLRRADRLGWPITAQHLADIWEAQDGTCPLTGQPMTIDAAELDHIIPRSRGGSNALPNLRWLSRVANQAKGDLLDEEFIALCRAVVDSPAAEFLLRAVAASLDGAA